MVGPSATRAVEGEPSPFFISQSPESPACSQLLLRERALGRFRVLSVRIIALLELLLRARSAVATLSFVILQSTCGTPQPSRKNPHPVLEMRTPRSAQPRRVVTPLLSG